MSLFQYDYTSASITYFCLCKMLVLPNLLTVPVLGYFFNYYYCYSFNALHKKYDDRSLGKGPWERMRTLSSTGNTIWINISSVMTLMSKVWTAADKKTSKKYTKRLSSNIFHQLQTQVLASFLSDIRLCARTVQTIHAILIRLES